MKSQTPEELQGQFDNASKTIEDMLPAANLLNQDQCREIIQRYTAAIEGNFVGWMGAAAICTRSIEGRYAASENLFVEMNDDHAGMLHEFANSAGALPTQKDFLTIAPAVSKIRQLVAEMSGLKTLVLMATLENTSGAFIPWLAELAKKSGSTNLRYTDVHGEADIEHANQFVWAVQHEMKQYQNFETEIAETIRQTTDLLEMVFQV